MGRKRATARALTLTEVLVASALLGAALVPAFQMVTRGMVLAKDTEMHSRAVLLAEREMENTLARADYDFDLYLGKQSESLGDGFLANVTETVQTLKKTVSVEVGHDEDSSGTLASNEVLVTFTTVVADTTTPGTLP